MRRFVLRRHIYTAIFVVLLSVLLYLRISVTNDYGHDAPLMWSLIGGGCCGVLYMMADWWGK